MSGLQRWLDAASRVAAGLPLPLAGEGGEGEWAERQAPALAADSAGPLPTLPRKQAGEGASVARLSGNLSLRSAVHRGFELREQRIVAGEDVFDVRHDDAFGAVLAQECREPVDGVGRTMEREHAR
jgi:hypothetical protein